MVFAVNIGGRNTGDELQYRWAARGWLTPGATNCDGKGWGVVNAGVIDGDIGADTE